MADSNSPDSTNPSLNNGTDSSRPAEDTKPIEKGSGASPQPPAESAAPGNTEGTFPAAYVGELRAENAAQRVKAGRSDKLAALLVEAMAHQTGLLADASDLPYSEDLLVDGFPDAEKVAAAIDDLLARKPHLGDRRPKGSVDQGARGGSEASVSDLGAILRQRAG